MDAVITVKFVAEHLEHLERCHHGRAISSPVPWAFPASATRNVSLNGGDPVEHRDEIQSLRSPFLLYSIPAVSTEQRANFFVALITLGH